MGNTAILVGVLAAVFAGTCWYAGERGMDSPARTAKIATILALVVLAVVLGAPGRPGGIALLVGLILSAVGDVALTRDDERSFSVGLAAFLLAHLAYVVAFVPLWFHPLGAVVVALLVAPLALLSFPRARRGAVLARGPQIGWSMTAYLVALVAMALAAGATGRVLLAVGAVLFALSDTVLALDRFDAPRARAHLAIMAGYHVAQAAIVTGVLL